MSPPSSNDKITVLIAGAGAVENAWEPVVRALQPLFPCPLNPDGANAVLARAVYLMRWWHSDPSEGSKEEFQRMSKWFDEIKNAIASELHADEACGAIQARPALRKLMENLVVDYSPRFGLLTTNWDTVIPQAVQRVLGGDCHVSVTPIHIHGSIANSATLYLPSEVIREPYRSHTEDHEVGVRHSTAASHLQGATRVILYGLSLDPLDAELTQVLSAGWSNSNLEEVLIVDPEHKKISRRVQLLLNREVRLLGINCETMEQEAEYTIH